MRLNRRVPNGTHGGVRGRGYAAPPTRLHLARLLSDVYSCITSIWVLVSLLGKSRKLNIVEQFIMSKKKYHNKRILIAT